MPKPALPPAKNQKQWAVWLLPGLQARPKEKSAKCPTRGNLRIAKQGWRSVAPLRNSNPPPHSPRKDTIFYYPGCFSLSSFSITLTHPRGDAVAEARLDHHRNKGHELPVLALLLRPLCDVSEDSTSLPEEKFPSRCNEGREVAASWLFRVWVFLTL